MHIWILSIIEDMCNFTFILFIFQCTLPFYLGAKQSLIQEIDDLKEFKKYIKTKPNVLVVFAKNSEYLL